MLTLNSSLSDPCHVLAVRVFTQEGRSANDDIDTVDTSLDSQAGVVHVTPDVSKDLGALEAELADGFAVSLGLGRGGRRGELDVLDTESIKSENVSS